MLPSTSREQEGFGIVLLEALACNVPIIITDIMGVAKEVKEKNMGVVTSPKDMIALEKAVINMLKNTTPSRKEKSSIDVSCYKWSNIAEQIENVYKGCLR